MVCEVIPVRIDRALAIIFENLSGAVILAALSRQFSTHDHALPLPAPVINLLHNPDYIWNS